MQVLERITHDPRMFGGKACVRGLRMPVHVILAHLAGGATREDILTEFPFLEPEDIQAALAYAALRMEQEKGAAA